MITTIPLDKLVASDRNVRQRVDPEADLELKADIAARGLLQNLVVTRVKKPRGCFAVEAGERRRRALQVLAEEGALPADHAVACLVVDASDGREASLAENFQRLAMNPADECLAFQALIDQGADLEGVARRFGLTQRFVEGRLRLAGLAPVVFDALGAGEISLDLAKAFAATPDRERQAWVYEQLAGYGGLYPDSVRRMMTQTTVSGGDRRARLVGEEAYLAEGGRIERDLFEDGSAARWLDVALLERLATEKMAALAEQAAAETGLAFVRPTLDSWIGYGRRDGLARVTVEAPAPTEEETAEIDALQAEIDGLADTIDDEEVEPAAQEAAEGRIAELSARIETIADKPALLDEERKAELGTFLLLGDDGVPRLERGYFREIVAEDVADDGANGTMAAEEPAASADGERKPAPLSQRLVDELAIQRRDVLALHLAVDPSLALDLAVFLMADRETGGHWRDRSGSSLTAAPPSDPVFGYRTPDAAATLGRQQFVDALERGWTEGETRAERFDLFRALPDDARYAWLGHCVAGSLEASLNLPGGRGCALHDHLGQVLGIAVARWWRPTGANYFDRVPKSMALAALAEVGGRELAARHGKAKKAELSEACERLFAGDLIVEAGVRAAALAWVPEVMRFAAVVEQPAQAEDPMQAEGTDLVQGTEPADEPALAEAPETDGDREPETATASGEDATGDVPSGPEDGQEAEEGAQAEPLEPGHDAAGPDAAGDPDEGTAAPEEMDEAA
jgi:ParB family chromosome partitioning protein